MKNVLKGLWVGSLAVSLLAGFALAVRAEDDKPMMGGPGRIERMKEKLGLSDDQVTKIKDLFKKKGQENKPLRDQVKIDMDTLQQKVDSKASDGEIKKVLDALSADRQKLESARREIEDQLKTILTPTQQAKFVLSMKERGREMMGKWMKNHKSKMNKGNDAPSDPPAGDQGSPTGN
jgi:Spy/CpxP family protein refolding chaperone